MADEEDFEFDIIEQYILDDADLEEYLKSKRLESLTEIPGAGALLVFLLSTIAFMIHVTSYPATFLAEMVPALESLNPYGQPAKFLWIIQSFGIAIISFAIALVSIRISLRFKSNAHSTGVDTKKINLDILARGMKFLKEREIEHAIRQLIKLKKREDNSISNSTEGILDEYLGNINEIDGLINRYLSGGVSESTTEFVQDTYEDFVRLLIEEISEDSTPRQVYLEVIASPDDSDYMIREAVPTEDVRIEAPSYLRIILKSFSGLTFTSFTLPFWFMYIIAAGAGIGVYLFINETLGIISVTILLTAMQIYDRRERRDDEDE